MSESWYLYRRRTFERIEKMNEGKKLTFERQESGHLSEMENDPFLADYLYSYTYIALKSYSTEVCYNYLQAF